MAFKPKEKSEAKPLPLILLPLLLVVLPVITGTIVYFYLVNNDDVVGESLSNKNPISYPSSRYVSVDNKIYFLKVGYGYFKLENVDVASFKPFAFKNEHVTAMGQDKHHVFSQQFILRNIDKESVVYLGGNIIRDNNAIFYGKTQIIGADTKTFQRVSFPNYPKFIVEMNKGVENLEKFKNSAYNIATYYSKDKNRVYYKSKPLQHADVNSLAYAGKNKTPPHVNNYIKDKQNAYYQSELLEGIDVKNFVAEQSRTLSYATDGKKHFINGQPFPEIVNNKFFGVTEPKLDEMKLLQRQDANHFHLVFLDTSGVYYFNEQKQLVMHAKAIENKSGFKVIDNGIFSDGNSIYFTNFRRIKSRKYGTTAHVTNVYKSQLKEKYFKKFKEIEGATLYKYKQDYYLSTDSLPSFRGNSSLVRLKNLNFKRNRITKEHIEVISDVDLILKIKTRF